MVPLLLRLLRLLPLLCGAHRHVALENLALRHQLAVYKRTLTRPKVRRSDRLFCVALSRVWADWRVPPKWWAVKDSNLPPTDLESAT